MAVARNMPTASFLTKIGKMQSAGCRLCKIARDARGESTDGLADETHGHMNSAGCEGMATTVTAAHHSIWRHLYDSMHAAAQKPKSRLSFVKLDKKSNISTLRRREEFLRICRKKELVDKAQDMDKTRLSYREKSGWKASQTNFTTGVRGSLHTNQFLTRLESLGVKNKNTREAIRNRTVQKTLSMSDVILKFFFIALNSKIEWTLQSLPTEIVNKNMERFNLHLQPPRT